MSFKETNDDSDLCESFSPISASKRTKQPITISEIIQKYKDQFVYNMINDDYVEVGSPEEHIAFLIPVLEAVLDELVLEKKELMDKWTLEHATIGLQEENMRNVGFNEAVDELKAKREEILK